MQVALSQSQRPKEYTDAMEALKHSFVKSIEIVQKLNVLGQKYGLSSQEIRKDIETALSGVVKPRQLRSILPLELKRKYNGNGKTAAAAKLPNATNKSFQFSGKIVRYSRGRHCIIISDKTDVSRFEGKEITVTISLS